MIHSVISLSRTTAGCLFRRGGLIFAVLLFSVSQGQAFIFESSVPVVQLKNTPPSDRYTMGLYGPVRLFKRVVGGKSNKTKVSVYEFDRNGFLTNSIYTRKIRLNPRVSGRSSVTARVSLKLVRATGLLREYRETVVPGSLSHKLKPSVRKKIDLDIVVITYEHRNGGWIVKTKAYSQKKGKAAPPHTLRTFYYDKTGLLKWAEQKHIGAPTHITYRNEYEYDRQRRVVRRKIKLYKRDTDRRLNSDTKDRVVILDEVETRIYSPSLIKVSIRCGHLIGTDSCLERQKEHKILDKDRYDNATRILITTKTSSLGRISTSTLTKHISYY